VIKVGLLLFPFFEIGCGQVHLAFARVFPASDHSQVEVEFPKAPYPQVNPGICILVFVSLSFCMKICSAGGLQLERV